MTSPHRASDSGEIPADAITDDPPGQIEADLQDLFGEARFADEAPALDPNGNMLGLPGVGPDDPPLPEMEEDPSFASRAPGDSSQLDAAILLDRALEAPPKPRGTPTMEVPGLAVKVFCADSEPHVREMNVRSLRVNGKLVQSLNQDQTAFVTKDGHENERAEHSKGGYCYAPFSQNALQQVYNICSLALGRKETLPLNEHLLEVIARNAGDDVVARAMSLDEQQLLSLFKKAKGGPLNGEQRAKILSKFLGGNHAAATPVSSDTGSEEPAAINSTPELPPASLEGVEDMDHARTMAPARPRTAEPRPEEAANPPQPPPIPKEVLDLIEKVAGTQLMRLAQKGLLIGPELDSIMNRAELLEPENKLKADERQALIDAVKARQPAFDWKGFGKTYGGFILAGVIALLFMVYVAANSASTPTVAIQTLEMVGGPVEGVLLPDGTWRPRVTLLSPESGPLEFTTDKGEFNFSKWKRDAHIQSTIVPSETPGVRITGVQVRSEGGLNELVLLTEIRGDVSRDKITPRVIEQAPVRTTALR